MKDGRVFQVAMRNSHLRKPRKVARGSRQDRRRVFTGDLAGFLQYNSLFDYAELPQVLKQHL
jgi:hypothetical protein